MKGKFAVSINLMKLEEQLEEHKPYATLAVSTTGIDNSNFDGHCPTRVSLRTYEYDSQTNSYVDNLHFDMMVQATPEALAEADKNKDNYDVFIHAGISEEEYRAGVDVLSPEEFKKQFEPYISALQEEKAVLIVNGGISFAEKYLGKIDCVSGIQDMAKDNLVLDQTNITREYFAKKDLSDEYFISRGLKKGYTLENLNAVVKPAPAYSFYNNTELMLDFTTRSKNDFLELHPDIKPASYDITSKFSEQISDGLIGTGKRTNIMSNFVQKYGREIGLLASEMEVDFTLSRLEYTESLSQQGKKNYKDGDLQKKLEILANKKIIDIDSIDAGNSTYHKLISAIEDNENKGIIIFHTATTGFEKSRDANGKNVTDTGFPIQFSALAYTRNESGQINFEEPKGLQIDIQAPRKQLLTAKQNKTFDTFADTGIDIAKYEQGIASDGSKVRSMDEAIQEISAFTKMFPLEDYQIVSIGGDFAQKAISHLSANIPLCNADCLDFTQSMKEYAYIVNNDKSYSSNILFNGAEKTIDNFTLKAYAKAQDLSIQTTSDKCDSVAQGLKKLFEQYTEIFQPEEKVIKQEKSSPVIQKEEPAPTVQSPEIFDEDGMFIEGNEYPTEKIEDNTAEMQAQKDFEEHLEQITPAPQTVQQSKSVSAPEPSPVSISNEQSSLSQEVAKPTLRTERPAPRTANFGRPLQTSENSNAPVYNTGARQGRPPISTAQPKPFSSQAISEDISPIRPQANGRNDIINGRNINRANENTANSRPINQRNAPTSNPSRPPLGENQRNPRPAPSIPAIGIDINKLIDTINRQNETINQQNATLLAMNATNAEQAKVIAEQNRQLMKAFEMQNALMQEMFASKASSKSFGKLSEKSDIDNIVVNLEDIKEQISNINTQIDGKASQALSEANVCLSRGQKELLEEVEKQPIPLNKG